MTMTTTTQQRSGGGNVGTHTIEKLLYFSLGSATMKIESKKRKKNTNYTQSNQYSNRHTHRSPQKQNAHTIRQRRANNVLKKQKIKKLKFCFRFGTAHSTAKKRTKEKNSVFLLCVAGAAAESASEYNLAAAE